MTHREGAISAPLFDLQKTLESGQVFHWGRAKCGGYLGLIGEVPVELEFRGGKLIVTPGTEELVAHYFALDHRLEEIYATFPSDPAMTDALAFCHGLRIMRQPLWECLGTFITSSMKQVKHIEQMSLALRQRFGQPVDQNLWAYPTPERLAQATEIELRDCGLGFRAKGLLGSAKKVAAGEVNLEAIRAMPDEEALAALCKLPGVGPKIANCVLLFGYERVRAFPIDVWIERVLRQRYFQRKRNVTAKRLHEFAASYFGPYGGYAQQYLFHHARNQPRSVWKKS